MLPSQECQLVGVLTNCRNTNRAGPVVVHVGLFERVLLQLISIQSGLILKNVVGCRRDRSLSNALRN